MSFLAFFMAFMALGARDDFMAFMTSMVKGGVAKSACKTCKRVEPKKLRITHACIQSNQL